MKRTPISIKFNDFPTEFHSLLAGATVYDSSCSPEARVIFIDKEGGYYLKSALKGKLQKEAEMTRFFREKGLGAAVLSYLSLEHDWLLTERVLARTAPTGSIWRIPHDFVTPPPLFCVLCMKPIFKIAPSPTARKIILPQHKRIFF